MEHEVVSREEWLDPGRALVVKEKEMSRSRDSLSAETRSGPFNAERCRR
jgi:predicted dithiol-disulfide oxidoreductase (DUF899 family)